MRYYSNADLAESDFGCPECEKKDEILNNVKQYFRKIVGHLYESTPLNIEALEDAIEDLRLELEIRAINNYGNIQITRK